MLLSPNLGLIYVRAERASSFLPHTHTHTHTPHHIYRADQRCPLMGVHVPLDRSVPPVPQGDLAKRDVVNPSAGGRLAPPPPDSWRCRVWPSETGEAFHNGHYQPWARAPFPEAGLSTWDVPPAQAHPAGPETGVLLPLPEVLVLLPGWYQGWRLATCLLLRECALSPLLSHEDAHTHTPPHKQSFTHTHTHTRMLAHIHTHVYAHIHSLTLRHIWAVSQGGKGR